MILNLYFLYFFSTIPKYLRKLTIIWNELELIINKININFILKYLKYSTLLLFKTLIDIFVYDNPGKFFRFTLNYQLISYQFTSRINLITYTNELLPIYSIIKLYKSANWIEREIWDMYGIIFLNHVNLRRILTDYGFKGFPLRKDFPLNGYIELFYDYNEKKILYKNIKIIQEYREFIFFNNWF